MNFETAGEDFLDFKCPYCGALNSFATSAAGLARECLNCMETFLVPMKEGESARRLPLPVETSRFRLRRFEPSDWKDLLEFMFDDEDDATGWLLNLSEARLMEVRKIFPLAVEAKDTGKVIGSFGLMFSDLWLNQMEISLTLGKPEALPGWETEAFDAALKFCFVELHLHRVFAQCAREDAQSIRIYQAAGMRQEAEFVKNHFVNGEWRSTLWFAMLAEKYFSEPSPKEKTS